jgi:hypothetical protein
MIIKENGTKSSQKFMKKEDLGNTENNIVVGLLKRLNNEKESIS